LLLRKWCVFHLLNIQNHATVLLSPQSGAKYEPISRPQQCYYYGQL
jgi:hypothetical protein